MNKILILSLFFFFVLFTLDKAATASSSEDLKNLQDEYFTKAVFYEYKVKNYLSADKFYQKSCNLNYSISCLWAGLMHIEKTKNIDIAKIYLNRSCDLKNKYACKYLQSVSFEKIM